MLPLTQTIPGHDYEIKWMFGLPEVLKFLKERSVIEGGIISVITKQSDCLIIGIEGRRILLDNEIARRIQVGLAC